MEANDILTWRIYFSKLFYLFIIACYISNVNNLFGQTFLNGSFEINNGTVGNDYIDLTNNQFNNLLSNIQSFGSGTVNIDLISTDNWGGFAQNGYWYIGLQEEEGSIDSISMELSDTIWQGEQYKLTFYNNARASSYYTSAYLQIGVSNHANEFGTLIYTTPNPAKIDKWTLQFVSFISPINAKYISVRPLHITESENCWVKIDNFCLSQDKYCIDLPEFKMPNVFTPNNDGINDTFKPIVFKGMKSGHLVVLNRWGQVVYETDNLQIGWDGQINGNPASDGVYFWKVEYTTIFDENKIEFGYLTLLR